MLHLLKILSKQKKNILKIKFNYIKHKKIKDE